MRARNFKPDFFKNEVLAKLHDKAKLLFIGLWCMADRDGRLEDRPKRIEAEVFPYQKVDVDRLLNALAGTKDPFIHRYKVNGFSHIEIVNFRKHQNPHPNERPSEIPKFMKLHDSLVTLNEGLGLIPSSQDLLNPHSLNQSLEEATAPKKSFPPTPQEVEAYAKTIGFEIDGDAFCAYYDASNWMRGKTKIVRWKACVWTWKKKHEEVREAVRG